MIGFRKKYSLCMARVLRWMQLVPPSSPRRRLRCRRAHCFRGEICISDRDAVGRGLSRGAGFARALCTKAPIRVGLAVGFMMKNGAVVILMGPCLAARSSTLMTKSNVKLYLPSVGPYPSECFRSHLKRDYEAG